MRAPRALLTLAVVIAAAYATTAAAQNYSFLQKSPVAYLTEGDKELLRAAFDEALNNGKDGQRIEWSSEASGNSGWVRVLDTHEDLGTTCRHVRAQTTAGGVQGTASYRLCRAEDGSWRFAPRRKQRPATPAK